MDNNGSYQFYNGDFYYGAGGWNDYTLDDERRAKSIFSRFFLSLFIYTIVANAVAIIAQVVVVLTGKDAAASILNSAWFVWGVNVLAMYVIAFPVLYLIVRGMRSVARTKRTMRASEFFVLLLVGEAFMYVGNIVGTFLNDIFGAFMGGEIENTTSELIESSPIWMILIVAVILGPIVEELIFRKLMMDKLGIYGDRMAIVVSSIAFGIFHGNFYQLFYATLLGLVLGYIYAKTSNIIYPILLHMIMNFWGSVVPMLMMDHINNVEKFYNEYYDAMLEGGELAAGLDIAPYYVSILLLGLYSIIQMGMVIAGLIIFFKKRRKIFVSDRCEVTIPKHRRAGVVMGNVGAILFAVIAGLTMLLNIVSPILEKLAAAAG